MAAVVAPLSGSCLSENHGLGGDWSLVSGSSDTGGVLGRPVLAEEGKPDVARTLFLVLSNPVDGRDDEYNRWYDEVHIRDVCEVPGVVSAQRYRVRPDIPPADVVPADGESGDGHLPQRHLAVYELDDDPAKVFGEFITRVGDGRLPLSDTLDMSSVIMSVWEPGARWPV